MRPDPILPAPRHARTGRTDEPTPNGTRDGKENGTRLEVSRTERNAEATRRRGGTGKRNEEAIRER